MIRYWDEYFFCGLAALGVLLALRLILGKRLSGTQRVFLTLLVLYLSAMFNVVGLPGLPYVHWDPTVNLIPFSDYADSRFLWLSGMNVVMLMPLGFLLPQIWKGFRSFPRVLLLGFCTSLGIELLQLFSFRATDVDDLIFNTLGAGLGFLAAKWLTGKRWEKPEGSGKQDLLSLLTVFGILFGIHFFLRYYALMGIYDLTH